MKTNTIIIDERFHGPPDSGNGGYVCGQLAQFIVGSTAAVRLRVPPPLDTEMQVRATEEGVAMFDGDTLVADARPASVDMEPPSSPSFEEAETAAQRFRGFAEHVFPTCFVCGPDRESGDGLRIFPGRVKGRDLVASPWIPHSSLAPDSGVVSHEFLWAALDCPGAFAFPQPEGRAVVLGELKVKLTGNVSVGERCVLTGWQLSHDGRKHFTATALYGESGVCRGLAIGTWIEIPPATKNGSGDSA